jgi:Mg2+-importing ATPase
VNDAAQFLHSAETPNSLLTQTLIIHIIRTAKLPFIESHASPALITTSIVICVFGIDLPFTVAGAALGFTPLLCSIGRSLQSCFSAMPCSRTW